MDSESSIGKLIWFEGSFCEGVIKIVALWNNFKKRCLKKWDKCERGFVLRRKKHTFGYKNKKRGEEGGNMVSVECRASRKKTFQIVEVSTASKEEQILGLIGLSKVSQIGPKTSRQLIAYCGGVEKIFRTSKRHLMQIPGVGEKLANILVSAKTKLLAEEELRFAESEGIQILTSLDDDYPELLKSTDCAPLVLYKKGAARLNVIPTVSIVGTRRPSSYGRKLAKEYAMFFAEQGFNVVSGLAYGIDIEAHEGVLEAGGTTIAVLGHGLDRIYPVAHTQKAQRIIENRGAMISEFGYGTPPDAYNFPARNRIISGMAHATIVVEARERGGAQITAKFAFDQNREVYAIPGGLNSPTSSGCNRLIRDHVAKLVTSPQEIVEDLKLILGEVRSDREFAPSRSLGAERFNEDEKRVVEIVQKNGTVCEIDLVRGTKLSVGAAGGLLLGLEIRGVLVKDTRRGYCLSM